MLLVIIALLSPAIFHWILRRLGIDSETFHQWCEGVCPCGA
jgi:hypothetical protein